VSPSPIRPIRTLGPAYLKLHRDTHAKHASFGTHRHPCLHATVRDLALAFAAAERCQPSLLDYGCGKGAFIDEMRALGAFAGIAGHDPAVDHFAARPDRRYDIVTCLDVLDQVEDAYVDAVIEDVAQLTGATAGFGIITRQTAAKAHLKPWSALLWHQLIQRRMRVIGTTIRTAAPLEFARGDAQERAIIVAAPPA
jgi:2-polyprenyl-3-methyl-5-hydroxy-6-metoxy-1,4-benzoquinol methylase